MNWGDEDLPRELTGADASIDEAMANDNEPNLPPDGTGRDEAPDIWPDQVRWMPRRPARADLEDGREITARPTGREELHAL